MSENIETIPEGARLIVVERVRQMTEEGYDAAHDDKDAERDCGIPLVKAAIAYLHSYDGQLQTARNYWPWDDGFKPFAGSKKPPQEEIRDLVKAGALIAAEIDRVQRLTK